MHSNKNLGTTLQRLRTESKLTQAQFSELFGVSQQSVQKWESNAVTPDLEKLILIAKWFDISLDALILGNDNRAVEEMKQSRIKPNYQNLHDWEFYPSCLQIEYQQSVEEGLDIEPYKELFYSVSKLPKNEFKKRLGDILFDLLQSTPQKEHYPYLEPSDLEQIQALRSLSPSTSSTCNSDTLKDQIYGAWMGRICGCMLGKTVECIRTNELIPFLKETNNFPMHRYIYRSDLTEKIIHKYQFGFQGRCYADEIDGMPVDDDTNYVVLAQQIIEDYGKDFTPYDVSRAWLKYQSKDAYCTAERVAFCNFIKGFVPPESAMYHNPYREWIGAQIRGDYFGYINPGEPERAAEMAWRDASISHVKNGIYGEMYVAAMLATAATTNRIETIIQSGLGQIPHTSRLYESITSLLKNFRNGMPQQACFDNIHSQYDEYSAHGWCHTISNAMIVTAALLYGNGDFGKSICMAVETGFDTDCNGATIGSILGMANGLKAIPTYWTDPFHDTLHTSIFNVGTVSISERVDMTMEHIAKLASSRSTAD